MEVFPENYIVNSSEYTPVYLIPSPSVTQAGSYILTPTNQEVQKPINDNLKSFYENSGNLETNVVTSPRPRILKKQSAIAVGNNLKLASFLLPKTTTATSTNNVVTSLIKAKSVPISAVLSLKPAPVTPVTKSASVITTVPLDTSTTNGSSMQTMEFESKVVRVGHIPAPTRAPMAYRHPPKIKPKQICSLNSSKHTSVQLLKLGETYHSLNQLSNEQMKIVNKALKIFSDPEKIPKEPAYDPVTNTKFIYKIVSPRDLTVVGKNKAALKQKRIEARRLAARCQPRPPPPVQPPPKKEKPLVVKHKAPPPPEPVEETPPAEPTVTRSGRTVRLPKLIVPEDAPHKPIKKKAGLNIATCLQCEEEFPSLYRLQRHYDINPSHFPVKTHSNLFQCLLAIVKSGADEEKANIFIQQLEELIVKLKNLLPCLTKEMEGAKTCDIGDDVGRLFGLTAGKYAINVSALECVKQDGRCPHDAPKTYDVTKPSQLWLTKHNEELANEKCPIKSPKRMWKVKRNKVNPKKIRLATNNGGKIELKLHDVINQTVEDSAICKQNISVPVTAQEESKEPTSVPNQIKPKGHSQFHSTHFDIRSSPIKNSSLMRKFQINPVNFNEVQIMRPLNLEQENEKQNEITESTVEQQLQEIFNESNALDKNIINCTDLSFDSTKVWVLEGSSEQPHSIIFETGLTPIKESNLIEPSLLHIKDEQNIMYDPNQSNSSIEAKSDMIDSLLDLAEKANGLYSETNMQPDPSSYIDPIMHTNGKSDYEEQFKEKSRLFEALSHVKERSNTLFEPMRKDKNSLISPSLIDIKDETGLFSNTIDKNSLMDSSLLMKDKPCDLIEPLFIKDDKSMSLDANHDLNSSDSHLSQGQSVLNFLETLGNELAYPETDIKHNTDDFQLDLFSFSSS